MEAEAKLETSPSTYPLFRHGLGRRWAHVDKPTPFITVIITPLFSLLYFN